MAELFYVCRVERLATDSGAVTVWHPEAPVAANTAEEAMRICVAEGEMPSGTGMVAMPASTVVAGGVVPGGSALDVLLEGEVVV